MAGHLEDVAGKNEYVVVGEEVGEGRVVGGG